MEKLSLDRVAEFSNGRCVTTDSPEKYVVSGVCADSREIQPGDLFVALKGGRFNGHDFLNEADRKGATAAMVEQNEMRKRVCAFPLILVDKTLIGLQNAARNYRRSLNLQTIAVAGSNGKTGTKEMVATVLGAHFSVLKNQGNLNNHIGVPLSLLKLNASHQLGIFEVGTNHPGELAPLLAMVLPKIGIITMIGEEHLEYFHNLEGVAQEEGTLAETLPPNGLLVLNADDGWVPKIVCRSRAPVVKFGFSESAEYRAKMVEMNLSGVRFEMITPKGVCEVRLQLIGRHQVSNALATAAVCEFLGLGLDQICGGLESVKPAKMRMEQVLTRDGVWIINDSYNANPPSMRAALETIKELTTHGKRFAVLGEMRELGNSSESAHFEIGRKAAESCLDTLVVVGEGARPMIKGARSVDSPLSCIEFFQDPKAAGDFVKKKISRGDIVLVKASRGVALEKILEGWL